MSRKSGSRRLLGLMSVSSKDGAACVRGLWWFAPYAGRAAAPFAGLATHHDTERWHKPAVPDSDLRFGDDCLGKGRGTAGAPRTRRCAFNSVQERCSFASGCRYDGRVNWKVAPGPLLGAANNRPSCASMIDREIDNPMPMPPG